jgi:putative addiction module component (TIGR02574 family)
MSATTTPEARELIDRALQLSSVEREAIALRLLDSIDPPPNAFESKEAFRTELQRRIEAIQNGTMKSYSIEETMAYLRQESSERRSQ